jgi:hypothetical protein
MADTPRPAPWPTCPEHSYQTAAWRDTAQLCKQIQTDRVEDRRVADANHKETTGKLAWIEARIVGLATGAEVAGLRVEVAGLAGALRGRAEGAAEVTGEVQTRHSRRLAWLGWVAAAVAAAAGVAAVIWPRAGG